MRDKDGATIRTGPVHRAKRRPPGRLDSHKKWTDRRGLVKANNIAYETYRQLALRTRRLVFVDFNPVTEFYAHTELVPRPDADFIKLTYLDNEALPKAQVREIELLKKNRNLWRIYGAIETAQGRHWPCSAGKPAAPTSGHAAA